MTALGNGCTVILTLQVARTQVQEKVSDKTIKWQSYDLNLSPPHFKAHSSFLDMYAMYVTFFLFEKRTF